MRTWGPSGPPAPEGQLLGAGNLLPPSGTRWATRVPTWRDAPVPALPHSFPRMRLLLLGVQLEVGKVKAGESSKC